MRKSVKDLFGALTLNLTVHLGFTFACAFSLTSFAADQWTTNYHDQNAFGDGMPITFHAPPDNASRLPLQPQAYSYPLSQSHWAPYRSPLDTMADGTDLEILILGQTGSGKTTFINTVANYFLSGSFGIRKEDQRVEVIIPTKHLQPTVSGFSHSESNVNNQSKSQTSKPKIYRLASYRRAITFIDTPGMGDTDGLVRDEQHLRKILKMASKRSKLSGIILFFNGAEARENSNKTYALEKLRGLIPDVAINNLIVVLTNTHKESSNFPIDKIVELGVSPDRIFYMNNSVLASDPELWSDPEVAARLSSAWYDSMRTIGNICEKLSANSDVIGDEFKKMFELRNFVLHEFHQVRLKFAEIQETQNAIENFKLKYRSHTAVAEDFKDFAKRATIITRKFVDDPNRHYSTVCTVHNVTCHDECSLRETRKIGDQIFTGCWAFENCVNGERCRACSMKHDCSFTNHYHARGTFQEVEQTLQDRLEEYKKKHEDATYAAKNAQTDIDASELALLGIKTEISRFADEVKGKLEDLKEICKGYNFVAELYTTIQLLKEDVSRYSSIHAIESANAFISALEIMAEELTEQGFAVGDDGNSPLCTGFGHRLTAEEVTKSRSTVTSYFKGGIGSFSKSFTKKK